MSDCLLFSNNLTMSQLALTGTTSIVLLKGIKLYSFNRWYLLPLATEINYQYYHDLAQIYFLTVLEV